MTIGRISSVRARRCVGDPPQKRAGRLVMRFFGSCALFVAALAGVMAGGSLAISGAAPAGASPAGITVNCPTDNLEDAIYSAAAGSTLLISGTCTGNFYINKDLTLSGPATLDGGGVPTQYGATLNVAAGTVVLNNLVIQDGVGIDNLGGGIWNSGQLTLNHSTVTHNTAFAVGGVFNMGQLTLDNSSVSNNTATGGQGGIFNCGANPGFQAYGLCTGAPSSMTLNNSIVSNNVAGSGDGGGIVNDVQAVMTLNGSTVSGNNTSGGNGGGIENNGKATLYFSNVSGNTTGTYGNGGGIENENDGSATLDFSTVSGNTAGSSGGGIWNQGTAALNSSIVSGNTGSSGGGIWNQGTAALNESMLYNNASTGGEASFGGGGGLSNTNTSTTTINNSIIRANTAAFVGGGLFAGGPMQINNSIVTGNSAVVVGGGMFVWNGPTTVANSAFSNNTDGNLGPYPDNPAGVWVAPPNFLGPGSNNPTFTTTHSTYS